MSTVYNNIAIVVNVFMIIKKCELDKEKNELIINKRNVLAPSQYMLGMCWAYLNTRIQVIKFG